MQINDILNSMTWVDAVGISGEAALSAAAEFGRCEHRGHEMAGQFVLTDYTSELMAHAIYDKLEDGTFSGQIPECIGVLAFGATLRTCEEELRSTLEDWILVGLKLGHRLPVIAGIDLNKGPVREPVDAV